ncbi:precorrin-3B synthase [Chthoniobacter flavus Ellin428]|uniref:Precorrin-3B synthase n=1 Tax=Chthoniobacter flavus Ellin428 TaxID=497964 RepID=B4D7K2_9BACT|nr:NirA family protein [Chthoniobacter flavus]EDY17619.1 precorrin-3B synthase [Chthoniobacter flavus Ellin428]TCO92351.1 NAD(P)H-dependent nitrite reductase catalytic subunit [Chthoniobacter flavus]
MSTASLPISNINGQPLNEEQMRYLTGFFAGVAARGQRFSDVEAPPILAKSIAHEDLVFEERVKKELHPLDAYPLLLEHAASNKAPEKEEVFRFKWNGLFYLSPNKEAFMARLRIPGGQLRTFQLRELANIAKQLTTGYVQITTRANLQMRLIQPKDTPEFLHRIQSVGLHARGSGADNIRNLTANPTAGVDPHELIDVMPLCHEMGQIILNDRSFYDLPRKFNIAYDGGGLIGTVEDTNDVGCKAVKMGEEIFFRIALGGATGHKAFARDLGVLVKPEELNKVVSAIVRVYIEHGNRGDRKKARLKHLLEKWTLEQYLEETEKLLGYQLQRVPLDPALIEYPGQKLPHSHVGVYPQKQKGLNYVGVAMPVGQITPKQMIRIAEIADLYGSGEIRLTVWQNFVIPNVPDHFVATVKKALRKIGFDTQQSNLRSGIIACTGNSYCKFAQANTKGHAMELADYLDKRIKLDQPVNIHLTGCPHSCAQHYMGDIGLLGTKAKIAGESVDGYHIFVGGGFGASQAVGRQVFNAIDFESAKPLVEKMLRGYLRHREGNETFQAFTARHDLNALQGIFSNEE